MLIQNRQTPSAKAKRYDNMMLGSRISFSLPAIPLALLADRHQPDHLGTHLYLYLARFLFPPQELLCLPLDGTEDSLTARVDLYTQYSPPALIKNENSQTYLAPRFVLRGAFVRTPRIDRQQV